MSRRKRAPLRQPRGPRATHPAPAAAFTAELIANYPDTFGGERR